MKKRPIIRQATNEASDGKRPPWSAAVPADWFGRHWLGGYRSWDLLGGLAQARSPTRAAATGIQRPNLPLSKVVAWLVLVWFGKR